MNKAPRVPRPPRPLDKPLGKHGVDHGHQSFFPNFLLKEWIVGATFIFCFALFIFYNPVTLGSQANPQDTSFIPMPDWYFYFLYQLLKYFPGKDIVVGVVLVPGIAMMLLMFLPWLDTSATRRPIQRIIATTSMMLTLFLVIWLTNEAAVQHLAEIGLK